jgi:hypothetical protein
MPTYDEDDYDDDWDDDNSDEDEEDTTDECPYCHKPVYDDAEQCPHCGQYISKEDRPTNPKPWWIIAGVAVCFYIIYRWTFG